MRYNDFTSCMCACGAIQGRRPIIKMAQLYIIGGISEQDYCPFNSLEMMEVMLPQRMVEKASGSHCVPQLY